METYSLDRFLKEHPFFEGLSEADLELLAGCGKNVVVEPDELVFKQGEPADEFYVVRVGRVVIELPAPHGGSVSVQTVGDGDVLGWSWIFPPYRWQFDARAVERTRIVTLDGKCLRGKCETDTRLGYEMVKRFARVMTDRLQATRLQLIDLYGNGGPKPGS